MQKTWVQALGWEDPLEKGTANHSSILTWKTPWAEEPGKLQSMRSQRVLYDWVTKSLSHTKINSGTSLVAQGIRIQLPVQGTWIQSLTGEDSTCHRATKPVHHNHWAHNVEPASHNHWAHMLQILKPAPRAQQEKPPQWETCSPQWRVAPARHNYESPHAAMKTQRSQKLTQNAS